MVAIAVKTDNENPILSPLFGKSKWFALIDNGGNITMYKNELQSGRAVVDYFVEIGVNKVIFNSMGANPYLKLNRANIECYYGGDERVSTNELMEKLKNGELIKVSSENMDNYIEQK